MHRRTKLLIIFLTISSLALSQKLVNHNLYFRKGWTFSANIGPTTTFGDVKENPIFPVSQPKNEWRYGGGVQLIRDFSPVFNIKGQIFYAPVAGIRERANDYFIAELVELNLCFSVNLSNAIRPYHKYQKFFISIFFGNGLAYYNSRLYNLTTNEIISQRGYGQGNGLWGRIIEGILLAGIEVDYAINPSFGIIFQSANRWMNSDSFDSVESGFPYDFYNITTIGITYKLKPTFYYPLIMKKY